jgi:hypothetical protein
MQKYDFSALRRNHKHILKMICVPIYEFLSQAKWFFRIDDKIYYCKNRDIPRDKRITIASATANEEFYKRIFDDKLIFTDIGNVENTGNLIQHSDRSCSRQCLSKDDVVNEIKNQLDEYGIEKDCRLTFKKYSKKFGECEMWFGNSEGKNDLTGKNIAVIGTPHKHVSLYLSIAYSLGYELSGDFSMKFQIVERNGYKFKCMTYVDQILRDIHLWVVESELIQAVGRARLVRKNCTVHLYSNYILPQAELIYEKKSKEKTNEIELKEVV